MAKLKFVLNRSGVRSLLRSEEMMSVCKDHANRMANAAGDGYEAQTYLAPSRATASVVAESSEARKDNSENNTLLKVMR